MPAAIHNFVIEQKATFKKRFTCRDKLKKPVNLTGYGARMQVREASGNVICDLSTENGGIIITPVTGTIDVIIPVAETTAFTFATALYDMKLINPDGTHDRLVQGKVTLSVGQTA